jgi:DNA-binding MarR family transcriptional regulator
MRLEDEIKQTKFRNIYHKLALNIMFTNNWLMNHQIRLFKQYDLTPQQFNVLRILRGQHPSASTVSLVQDRMLDKMSNASRLIEKLRQKGLVIRRENEKDRRNMDVTITDDGLNLLKIFDKMDDNNDAILKIISEEDARILNELLDKIRG